MSELKISNKDRIEGQIRLLDVAGKQIERLESENDKLTEENKRLREALIEIESLPEVRMDESSFIARKAIGFKQ